MSDPNTVGLACSFIIGVHGEPPWEGFEQPCGQRRGTMRDPRQNRYDVGLCPRHMAVVVAALGMTDERQDSIASDMIDPDYVHDEIDPRGVGGDR